jgi:hypothetical protein
VYRKLECHSDIAPGNDVPQRECEWRRISPETQPGQISTYGPRWWHICCNLVQNPTEVRWFQVLVSRHHIHKTTYCVILSFAFAPHLEAFFESFAWHKSLLCSTQPHLLLRLPRRSSPPSPSNSNSNATTTSPPRKPWATRGSYESSPSEDRHQQQEVSEGEGGYWPISLMGQEQGKAGLGLISRRKGQKCSSTFQWLHLSYLLQGCGGTPSLVCSFTCTVSQDYYQALPDMPADSESGANVNAMPSCNPGLRVFLSLHCSSRTS